MVPSMMKINCKERKKADRLLKWINCSKVHLQKSSSSEKSPSDAVKGETGLTQHKHSVMWSEPADLVDLKTKHCSITI